MVQANRLVLFWQHVCALDILDSSCGDLLIPLGVWPYLEGRTIGVDEAAPLGCLLMGFGCRARVSCVDMDRNHGV